MGKRITIHQPEHMPYLGFFHKMAQADLYVLLDSVQFSKNNFQNRNRFVDRSGNIFFLSVPVVMRGHTERTIADMEIDGKQPWARKYWGRLRDAYCRHPFFGAYETELETILSSGEKNLANLNIRIIEFFRAAFGIATPMVRSSSLNTSGQKTELLLGICWDLEASAYLSGPSGKDYLEGDSFRRAGIDLEFQRFVHPVYPAPNFHPYLSALDLLMNAGPRAGEFIRGVHDGGNAHG